MMRNISVKPLCTSVGCFFLLVAEASAVNAAAESGVLHGLFCDLTDGSKPYRKTDCVCIEFIDQKNIATFNYRKGKKARERTYGYVIKDDRLTIDLQGDGGLQQVELIIKSNDSIVSRFIESRNRSMSFERQARLPDICW